MSLIQQYQHKGEGYNPYLITPNWQVAQLNYAQEEALESITCLDLHHKTDEVFFLIEGTAVLIAAEIEDDKIEYDLHLMRSGVRYNIPKGVWHKIAMQAGSKVLIIENSNTHLPLPKGDYEFNDLTDKQKMKLQNLVNSLFTDNTILE